MVCGFIRVYCFGKLKKNPSPTQEFEHVKGYGRSVMANIGFAAFMFDPDWCWLFRSYSPICSPFLLLFPQFLFREIVAFHHEARSRMPFSFGVLGFLWSAPKRKTSGWSQDRGWDSSHFFFVIRKKGSSRRAKEQSFLFGVLPFNPAPDYDCHAPSGHMGMPGSAGNMVAGREALGTLLAAREWLCLPEWSEWSECWVRTSQGVSPRVGALWCTNGLWSLPTCSPRSRQDFK